MTIVDKKLLVVVLVCLLSLNVFASKSSSFSVVENPFTGELELVETDGGSTLGDDLYLDDEEYLYDGDGAYDDDVLEVDDEDEE